MHPILEKLLDTVQHQSPSAERIAEMLATAKKESELHNKIDKASGGGMSMLVTAALKEYGIENAELTALLISIMMDALRSMHGNLDFLTKDMRSSKIVPSDELIQMAKEVKAFKDRLEHESPPISEMLEQLQKLAKFARRMKEEGANMDDFQSTKDHSDFSEHVVDELEEDPEALIERCKGCDETECPMYPGNEIHDVIANAISKGGDVHVHKFDDHSGAIHIRIPKKRKNIFNSPRAEA